MPGYLSDALKPDGDPFAGMSPVDAFKLRQELASRQTVTPEQRAANLKQTGWEALSVIPGPANAISAKDAWDSGKDAVREFGQGNLGRGALASALAGLSGFGAVTGLPTSKWARDVAKDAGLTTRIFAGPMAKTADHDALARAREMKDAGASRDDIWRDAGWDLDNRDGVPRFEIDDSAMAVTPSKNKFSGEFSSYKSAIKHPELYDAYPPMQRDRVTFDHRIDDSGIAVENNPNAIGTKKFDTTIGMKGRQRWTDRVVTRPSEVREHTIHELQHNAQTREGFAPGASPQDIFEGIMEKNPGMSPEAATDMAIDQYKRTAGEVEARNVAARLNMSAAERRATPPWLTQDVPDEQQRGVLATALGKHMASIPAWHGSPHDFDAFDMSKIGTGEKALTRYGNKFADRGYGHYFADEREVGDSYRSMMAGDAGKLYNVSLDVEPDQLLHWNKAMAEQSPSVQQALRGVSGDFSDTMTGGDIYKALESQANRRPEEVSRLLRESGIPGTRYEASQDPSKFAAYQGKAVPSDEGATSVRTAVSYLDKAGGDVNKAMQDVVATADRVGWPDADLNAILNHLASGDIALNQTARPHNYVIFDDKLVKITGKE